MALATRAKRGLGGAAVALMAVVGVGLAPAPAEQLPTVKVFHNPT